MKTERNILIAFILNLSFSVIEFFGGIITGSVAIISDAVHDVGDAISIGVSYLLERISKRKPDNVYTYGYARYSVFGGFITTIILLISSVIVIYNAINRIISPTEINYNGMIIFAVIGVCINLCAAFFTRKGGSLNQKAVNLHMLEDVLGWIVVLVGAIVMRYTNFTIIDPIMSIGVSIFIFINSIRNIKEIADLLLEKVPLNVSTIEIKEHITEIDGVLDVHHIHIWSLDGHNHLATMHITTDSDPDKIKTAVREELREHGICHATIEIESGAEHCPEENCQIDISVNSPHAHHHYHHNHGHHHH